MAVSRSYPCHFSDFCEKKIVKPLFLFASFLKKTEFFFRLHLTFVLKRDYFFIILVICLVLHPFIHPIIYLGFYPVICPVVHTVIHPVILLVIHLVIHPVIYPLIHPIIWCVWQSSFIKLSNSGLQCKFMGTFCFFVSNIFSLDLIKFFESFLAFHIFPRGKDILRDKCWLNQYFCNLYLCTLYLTYVITISICLWLY